MNMHHRSGFKRAWLAIALSFAVVLSACDEPAAPTDTPTQETASRFLHQATLGANQADIDHFISLGYEGWMNEQFTIAAADTYADYVDRAGPPACEFCTAQGVGAVQEAFWYQAIEGKDQLRQRVALALSELFVISGATNTTLAEQYLALASFETMLAQNAFGNFRTILEKVALHPAMGVFLSHRQNDKEDATTGRLPDENFAREVMQLFTIGKWELNVDGTRTKDANGNDIPTYTQADVMGMAKVFTGWSWGGSDTSEFRWNGYAINGEDPRQWDLPMQPYPQHHSSAEKVIVGGVVIPANTNATDSVRIALDTLYTHKNAGPFIATHLIKRLVTSNPSPQYVARVAGVFNYNAQNVRGDMRAVVRAVLFDPEARSLDKINDPNWGKMREPVIRVTNYMRAFNARSTRHAYTITPLQISPYDVGQTVLMAPSVFNFFTPDYSPPGVVAAQGLTAPEFQIFDEATSVGYMNYMQRGIDSGFGTSSNPITPDYTTELSLAGDPAALVTRMALLFNGGQISSASRTLIETAIKSIDSGASDWKARRVKIAAFMFMASPDYLIQK